MGFRQCEALTVKGLPCRGGAMAMSKYCGAHTDMARQAEGKVVMRTLDIIETLRFHASKPDSPAFYGLAAEELERLRADNKMLRERLYRRTTRPMNPTASSEVSP